jgi:hypothetical protein
MLMQQVTARALKHAVHAPVKQRQPAGCVVHVQLGTTANETTRSMMELGVPSSCAHRNGLCSHENSTLQKSGQRTQLPASYHSGTQLHTNPHTPTRSRAHGHSPRTSCKLAAHTCIKEWLQHSTSGITDTLCLCTQLTKTHAAAAKCCDTHLPSTVKLRKTCAQYLPFSATTTEVRLHTRVSTAASNMPHDTHATRLTASANHPDCQGCDSHLAS